MLSIRQLKVHRGGKPVVHGLDLDIPGGEITALLGANGAGKSSTVLAIGGAIPAAAGSIELEGRPLRGLSADAVRHAGVAIVPEGHRVLGQLSVRDNLLAAATVLPRPQVDAAVSRMLAMFPDLVPRLDVPGRALSGGQKQMVCLAQAMMVTPRVLVIDELSLGLAPLVVKRLAEVIQQVAAEGVAVLLIEQFTTLALRVASRACVLERGHAVFAGTAAELRERADEVLHGSYLGSTKPVPRPAA